MKHKNQRYQDNFPIWDDGPYSGGGGGGGGGEDGEAIPGYNLMVVIAMISVISIIIARKYRKQKQW